MDTPYINLKLTINQARLLSRTCELVSRLHMGQTDVLMDISSNANWDNCLLVKKILFPEFQSGGYYGINSNEISDEARQLTDIKHVVRHHLAWREQKNTPETRKWPEQLGVHFDTPSRYSHKEPLPEIEEVDVRKD